MCLLATATNPIHHSIIYRYPVVQILLYRSSSLWPLVVSSSYEPIVMAGASRNASPMKRLMTELQTYQSDPNEALLELGPADDDVMHWRAVMKGVVGTAYEGTFALQSSMQVAISQGAFTVHPENVGIMTNIRYRRPLASRHPHLQRISPLPSFDPLHNPHLPPQCRLQDG